MSRSIFIDDQPFIYGLSAVAAYFLSWWLIFGHIKPDVVYVSASVKQSTNQAALASASGSFHLLQIDNRVTEPPAWFANRHPELLKWGELICLLMAFAGAVLIPSILIMKQLVLDFRLHTDILRQRWLWVVAVFILLAAISQIAKKSALNTSTSPTDLLDRYGLLFTSPVYRGVAVHFIQAAGFTCLTALVALSLAIANRNHIPPTDLNDETQSRHQRNLTRHFWFLAVCVSILIAGGTLGFSMLRELAYAIILPASETTRQSLAYKSLIPASFQLYYGLNFSIFLAAALIPIYFYLRRSGELALAQIRLIAPSGESELDQLINQPNRLLWDTVRLGILILLPFISLAIKRIFELIESLMV